MYKAIDIARLLIWQTNTEHGDPIINLKQQKLLFYQQGFWLTENNEPICAGHVEGRTYASMVSAEDNLFLGYSCIAIDVQKASSNLL